MRKPLGKGIEGFLWSVVPEDFANVHSEHLLVDARTEIEMFLKSAAL